MSRRGAFEVGGLGGLVVWAAIGMVLGGVGAAYIIVQLILWAIHHLRFV